MNGLSPWGLSAMAQFKFSTELYREASSSLLFKIFKTSDAIWIAVNKPDTDPLLFRACYIPGGFQQNPKLSRKGKKIFIKADTAVGRFEIIISTEKAGFDFLKYSCTLTPRSNLFFPFSPRDILTIAHPDAKGNSMGEIHMNQVGTRSGLMYFSLPERDLRILYFQNLTTLSPYAEFTGTSLSEVVGGQLPEVGLSLPPAIIKPLPKGKKVTLSDAIIAFKAAKLEKSDQAVDYLDLLSEIYIRLSKPETRYLPWPGILKKGLKDLIDNPGCWSMVGGNQYLNAYVSDYQTPPEIMVQLAVLLPLVDYVEWGGESLPIMKTIKDGLAPFYSEKLKTLLRWHPAAADQLKGEEEQKMPMVMDSWYLHHPLLNLSRLAIKGDQMAERLFLDSLPYAIKVAHRFKYQWPVFYKMDTLEVIKAETKQGEGGEQDVAGLYAHVMLQAYELTGAKKYLQEAQRAAKKLNQVGYKIMYQANNTAFGAGAMLRLYKLTKKQVYLQLSYKSLASLFQNVQLWDCNYGFGKKIPTFFAIFPLSDAPYTAAYEEQEVFCAFHDYLKHAQGIEILASVRLLCAEFIRHLINRSAYYYPPMLPQEMISKEVKTGEVDPGLWIALEDIHDGVEPSGQVGQEVYGAGNAFGILPRHYIKLENEDFLIFVDCPTSGITKHSKSVSFSLIGDPRLDYRLRITPSDELKGTLKTKFKFKSRSSGPLLAVHHKQDLELSLKGNEFLAISWN